VVANHDVTPTKEIIENRNVRFDPDLLTARVRARAKSFAATNAEALAEHHFGDAIYTNMIMLGMAWQNGLIPISEAAIKEANRLNKVKVKENAAAFDLGRIAAVNPGCGSGSGAEAPGDRAPEARRADRAPCGDAEGVPERRLCGHVRGSQLRACGPPESNLGLGEQLTMAAATYLSKLMAYKDEYEVARLYTRPEYKQAVEDTFREGHEADLPHGPADDLEEEPQGRADQAELRPVDDDGVQDSEEPEGAARRRVRLLRQDRRAQDGTPACGTNISRGLRFWRPGLKPEKHSLAVEIASILPDDIRGYGHVKEKAVGAAEAKLATLMAKWNSPVALAPRMQAAE
jgi:indolepyruvate ferredoxin oxidoreductase